MAPRGLPKMLSYPPVRRCGVSPFPLPWETVRRNGREEMTIGFVVKRKNEEKTGKKEKQGRLLKDECEKELR